MTSSCGGLTSRAEKNGYQKVRSGLTLKRAFVSGGNDWPTSGGFVKLAS